MNLLTLFVSGLLIAIISLITYHLGIIKPSPKFVFPFIVIILVSIVLALLFFIFFGKRFIEPITNIAEATKKVGEGEFDEALVLKYDYDPNTEIGLLINNFNTMVRELKKNEIFKSDFISNVSHEFKTPLSTIQGYATLLQSPDLTLDERNIYTSYIIEACQKLTTLTSNILKLSKIDNQEIKINHHSYRLDEQIREVILSYEKQWTEKNIDLDIELDELYINSDEDMLNQVWANLIGNAIKFSNQNGIIKIRLTQKEGCVEFIIEDNGIGMSQETIEHIYDKFYQGDNSHSKEGNGLGLSLVKKILDLIGGEIKVSSKLDQGTCFIVNIKVNI